MCIRECDPEWGRRLKPELRLARAHVWDGLPVHIPHSAIKNEYNKNSKKKKKDRIARKNEWSSEEEEFLLQECITPALL